MDIDALAVDGLLVKPMKMSNCGTWRGAYFLDPNTQECVGRTCSSCRVPLPREMFTTNPKKKYGINQSCKTCHNRDSLHLSRDPSRGAQARGDRNKRRTPGEIKKAQGDIHPDGTKKCRRCRESKPLTSYYTEKIRGDALAQPVGRNPT